MLAGKGAQRERNAIAHYLLQSRSHYFYDLIECLTVLRFRASNPPNIASPANVVGSGTVVDASAIRP